MLNNIASGLYYLSCGLNLWGTVARRQMQMSNPKIDHDDRYFFFYISGRLSNFSPPLGARKHSADISTGDHLPYSVYSRRALEQCIHMVCVLLNVIHFDC